MGDEGVEIQECEVCGRHMLYGERTRDYATPDGERRAVCDLCRAKAQRAGWVRADRADRGTATPRRPEPEPRPRARRAPARDPEPSESPERRIRRAIERFNDSEHRRTVAGLSRSLGRPRVAAVTPAEAPDQVRLTVAWDLSWYQWKVEFTDRQPAVRAFRNGKEVSELGPADRAWNARAAEDGRLQLRLGAKDETPAPDAAE